MIFRLFAQTLISTSVMGAVLFLAAGTTHWPGAWAYLAEFAILGVGAGGWLARRDPDLLAERLKPPVQHGQSAWDRVFMIALFGGFCVWLATMGLEIRRAGVGNAPLWTQVLGAVLMATSILISCIVFAANSFAATAVRAQHERGQRVITTGPYAIVRHPMYAGAWLFFPGAALILGSLWGLAAVPIFVVAIAVRSVGEERMLRRELEGYDDYARKVRWRLAPYIW